MGHIGLDDDELLLNRNLSIPSPQSRASQNIPEIQINLSLEIQTTKSLIQSAKIR